MFEKSAFGVVVSDESLMKEVGLIPEDIMYIYVGLDESVIASNWRFVNTNDVGVEERDM